MLCDALCPCVLVVFFCFVVFGAGFILNVFCTLFFVIQLNSVNLQKLFQWKKTN